MASDPGTRRRIRRGKTLRLVLPSLLAICLFVVTIFAILIPGAKEAAIGRKREMTRELTTAAWHMLGYFQAREERGELDRARAQAQAIAVLRAFRYGPDHKDYLWITDREPRMIMHPYRPDLEGEPLGDFTDSHGKHLFLAFVDGVRDDGEAVVDYYWQHQDQTDRIVPKISYVRHFAPWDWIVGTGIYIEDVRAEIDRITRHLWLISAAISCLIGIILLINGRISLRIEARRQRAEDELRASRERYRALLDANQEGVVLISDGQVRTANDRARQLLGHHVPCPVINLLPAEHALLEALDGSPQVVDLQTATGARLACLVVASTLRAFGQEGIVLTIKRLDETPATEGIAAIEHLCAHTGIGVMRCAPGFQGRIESANQACAIMLGHAHAEELIGQAARHLFADPAERSRTLRRLGSGGAIRGVTIHLRRHDGSVRPVQVWGHIEHSEREDDRLVLLLHDHAEEEAQRQAGIQALAAHLHSHHPDRAGLEAIRQAIAAAPEASALRACQANIQALALAQIDAGFGSRAVSRCLSDGADAIFARIIALELARRGPPPRAFCVLVVGSQGRREQTLVTDQDNALVYADGDDADGAPAWFLAFAEAINQAYDAAGYALCHGEAMARNPKWNQSLSAWKATFTNWIHYPEPQDLIDVNIFFDFRPLAGEAQISEELRQHLFATARGRDVFFLQLSEATLAFKPPLGLFGGLRLDQDAEHGRSFDIKSAILPLTNFARLYALAHGIPATSSDERCEALARAGELGRDSARQIAEALAYLLDRRLGHQAAALHAGRSPDNHLEAQELSEWDAAILKKIFAFFSHLQSRIRYDFARQA